MKNRVGWWGGIFGAAALGMTLVNGDAGRVLQCGAVVRPWDRVDNVTAGTLDMPPNC